MAEALCDPGGTRTHNLQNRNLTFYPLNYGARLRIEDGRMKKFMYEGLRCKDRNLGNGHWTSGNIDINLKLPKA